MTKIFSIRICTKFRFPHCGRLLAGGSSIELNTTWPSGAFKFKLQQCTDGRCNGSPAFPASQSLSLSSLSLLQGSESRLPLFKLPSSDSESLRLLLLPGPPHYSVVT
eukprot:990474-Rhodomonas_salina.2